MQVLESLDIRSSPGSTYHLVAQGPTASVTVTHGVQHLANGTPCAQIYNDEPPAECRVVKDWKAAQEVYAEYCCAGDGMSAQRRGREGSMSNVISISIGFKLRGGFKIAGFVNVVTFQGNH